jgi:hypothetical protein
MAQTIVNSFNGGLMSDFIAGRVDLPIRFRGGRVVQDFIPTVQGPLVSRPGTLYEGSVFDSTKRTHLIPMNTASGTNYLLEMSEYLIRFWKDTNVLTGSAKTISSVGSSATITISSAGGYIQIDWPNHGLLPGTPVVFSTSGSLAGTGITAGTTYYVFDIVDAAVFPYEDSFLLTTTPYEYSARMAYVGGGAGTHTGVAPIITTSTVHGFKSDDVITISADNGVTGFAGTWVVKSPMASAKSGTVDTAGNLINCTSHGYSNGEMVTLIGDATTAGAGWYLNHGKRFFVTNATTNTFQLSINKGDSTAADLAGVSVNTQIRSLEESKFDQFMLAPLDGAMEHRPLYKTLYSTTAGSSDQQFYCTTQSTNITQFSTYASYSGGSTASWIGKHTPYSEADLFDGANRFDIGYSILGDSIFFAWHDEWPRKLTVSSDYDWDFDLHAAGVLNASTAEGATAVTRYAAGCAPAPYFYDGPYLDRNSDRKSLIYFTSTSSSSVGGRTSAQQTSGERVFDGEAIRSVIRWDGIGASTDPAFGVITDCLAYIPSDTTASGVEAYMFLLDEGSTSSASPEWRLGVYGIKNGYPKRVSFCQDRMALMNVRDLKSRIDMSESSDYTSFSPTDVRDIKEVGDANAINFQIAAQAAGEILWGIQSPNGFYVGCSGGIYLISGSDGSLLVPGEITQTTISTYGAENIPPLQIGSDIYYVEIGGKKIRKISTDGVNQTTQDASRLFFDSLESPIIGWTFSRKLSPMIVCHLQDGSILGIVAEQQDDVFAGFTWDIGGSFSGGDSVVESVAAVRNSTSGDELYMVVKRTVNGSTVRYVERLADSIYFDSTIAKESAICADSAYLYSGVSATNVPASSLSHLEGQSVDVVADGVIITGKTVASGILSPALTTGATTIMVGLSFRPAYETLNVEMPEQQQLSIGQRKRVNWVDIGFWRTLGAKVGRSSSYMNEITFGSYSSTNVSLFSGVKKQPFNGDHTEEPRVRIEQVVAAPICIQYMVINLEVYK